MSPAPQSRMLAERGTSLTCSQMHTNTCTSSTCLPPPRVAPGLATPGTAMELVSPEACQSPAGTCFGKEKGVWCSPFEASQEQ